MLLCEAFFLVVVVVAVGCYDHVVFFFYIYKYIFVHKLLGILHMKKVVKG